jgi:membrane AbrB-like protein
MTKMASPARLPQFGRVLLTLAVGAIGGEAFSYFHVPLAWMIGALVTTTIAALFGAPVTVPRKMRDTVIPVLGVMLGSSFNPEILDRLGSWAFSLLGLMLYIVVSTGVLFVLLRRFAGYDPVTAYFAAAPGGLNEMVLVGSALGGDDRTLALTHAARVMLVVMTIPLWFVFTEGYRSGGSSQVNAPTGLVDLLILLGCAVVGYFLGRLLRLPAATLLGPMLLSAGVHLAGVTQASPPWFLVALAQLIVGGSLGCRFVGVHPRVLARIILISIPGTAVLLGITLIFGFGLHLLTGLPTTLLVLAYAPGGLTEMSLIAFDLGQDTPFVASHHLIRITLIILFAPLVFRLLTGRSVKR